MTVVGVTGASGFLGRYLVDHLAAKTDARVRALTRTLGAEHAEHAHVTWMQGDLNSPGDCATFVDGVDAIVHLAHANTPLTSNAHLPADALVNLVPSLTLLQAIRDSGSRPQVVLASSGGAVYQPRTSGEPIDEDAPAAPASSYGIQKLALEHYLRMAAAEGWLTATALRIGNAYGTLLPRERLQGFIGVLSQAFLAAAEQRDEFEVYNIGSGVGHSVREILSLLEQLTEAKVPVEFDDPTAAAERLPSWVVLDVTKARERLGWEARIELESGLRRLWNEVWRER